MSGRKSAGIIDITNKQTTLWSSCAGSFQPRKGPRALRAKYIINDSYLKVRWRCAPPRGAGAGAGAELRRTYTPSVAVFQPWSKRRRAPWWRRKKRKRTSRRRFSTPWSRRRPTRPAPGGSAGSWAREGDTPGLSNPRLDFQTAEGTAATTSTTAEARLGMRIGTPRRSRSRWSTSRQPRQPHPAQTPGRTIGMRSKFVFSGPQFTKFRRCLVV
jgi:hypothetical protein